MNQNFTVLATSRQDVGKGASRRLRRTKQIPGIVYGAGKEPQKITVDHTALLRSLENEAFYSRILNLKLDNKDEQVVLRDMQRHPFKPTILHIDLQRVSATEKISMRVPVHFLGAELSPAIKVAAGLISHLMSEIEVRCLPKDLPEFIEVDLSKLEINQNIHLSDLKLGAGVEIVSLVHGEDKAIASAYIPRVVVEEETAPVAAEVPVAGATPAEGEAKVEGEGKEGKPETKGKAADKDKK